MRQATGEAALLLKPLAAFSQSSSCKHCPLSSSDSLRMLRSCAPSLTGCRPAQETVRAFAMSSTLAVSPRPPGPFGTLHTSPAPSIDAAALSSLCSGSLDEFLLTSPRFQLQRAGCSPRATAPSAQAQAQVPCPNATATSPATDGPAEEECQQSLPAHCEEACVAASRAAKLRAVQEQVERSWQYKVRHEGVPVPEAGVPLVCDSVPSQVVGRHQWWTVHPGRRF